MYLLSNLNTIPISVVYIIFRLKNISNKLIFNTENAHIAHNLLAKTRNNNAIKLYANVARHFVYHAKLSTMLS